MSHPAIVVENLGKEYQLGLREQMNQTFREAIIDFAHAPIRRFKDLAGFVPDANKFWALKDVSFEIQPGEVVGIIGRNGAGKSTLLKILSRITEPTKGRATIHGRVGSLLEVGTGFHQELTGRENVYLNGSILGMSKREIDRKFDEIVDFAGVDKFLDTQVKRYSSGMKVRLGFAVAAHLEPEILIVDEVLAVGDFEFQKKCLGKMNDVASSGRTVLFVSHNMAAMENLCTRGILFELGGITEDSQNPSELIKRYLNAESETFDHPIDQIKRNSRHTPIIQDVTTLHDGKPTQRIRCGDAVSFRVDYFAKHPIAKPTFGIAIDDIRGNRIFWLHSRWQHSGFDVLYGHGQVECTVPELRLLPGEYYLTLSCCENDRGIDVIQRARNLIVTESDIFGTGKIPDSSKCCTYTNATWRQARSSHHHGAEPQVFS